MRFATEVLGLDLAHAQATWKDYSYEPWSYQGSDYDMSFYVIPSGYRYRVWVNIQGEGAGDAAYSLKKDIKKWVEEQELSSYFSNFSNDEFDEAVERGCVEFYVLGYYEV